MAAAMAALAEPDWSALGYMAQGINNDPLKLRAMLKRLHLPGYDDPAGVEKNPERWRAIVAVELSRRNHLRGNGTGFETKWKITLVEGEIQLWWDGRVDRAAFTTGPPRPSRTKPPSGQDLDAAKAAVVGEKRKREAAEEAAAAEKRMREIAEGAAAQEKRKRETAKLDGQHTQGRRGRKRFQKEAIRTEKNKALEVTGQAKRYAIKDPFEVMSKTTGTELTEDDDLDDAASLASMPPPPASERSRAQQRAWAQLRERHAKERNAAEVDDEMQTSTGDESLAMSTRSNTSTWDADSIAEQAKGQYARGSEGNSQVRNAGGDFGDRHFDDSYIPHITRPDGPEPFDRVEGRYQRKDGKPFDTLQVEAAPEWCLPEIDRS
jgi:hypothetical protein